MNTRRPVKYWVYPYRDGSHGASALAHALGGKVIRLQGSRYRHRPWKRVINWGSCHCPGEYQAVNPSSRTRIFRDKLETFKAFSQLSPDGLGSVQTAEQSPELPRVPAWTTSRQRASEWLSEEVYKTIVCRLTLTGQAGSGIILADKTEDLRDAPLYVEYVKKDAEYRIHVFRGRVIDSQKKIRDPDREPTNWQVRSHANGFIFARNNIQVPEDVTRQALLAVKVSGLDFSAVDVVWNQKRGKAYVLELNQSPGLEGTTVNVYAEAIRNCQG